MNRFRVSRRSLDRTFCRRITWESPPPVTSSGRSNSEMMSFASFTWARVPERISVFVVGWDRILMVAT